MTETEPMARFAQEQAPAPGIDGTWRHCASQDPRALSLGLHDTQFVPPDGCVDLIVQFSGGRFETAFLLMPAEHFELVPIAAGDDWFGVRFELGVGGALLRQRTDVEGIAERLFAVADGHDTDRVAAELAKLGESLVEGVIGARPPWLEPALASLRDRCGNASVRSLAREVGVSERTLQRGFLDWVGATPKLLARTLRAQAGVERALGRESLAEVAATLGYADQAHFSRELRELWGLTPGQLRRPQAGMERAMSDFFKTLLGSAA